MISAQMYSDHGLILQNILSKQRQIDIICMFSSEFGLWNADQGLSNMLLDFKIKLLTARIIREREQGIIESKN